MTPRRRHKPVDLLKLKDNERHNGRGDVCSVKRINRRAQQLMFGAHSPRQWIKLRKRLQREARLQSRGTVTDP